MIFRFPGLLWLLPLAGLAAWWRGRLSRRAGIPFSHGTALAGIPAGWAARAHPWLGVPYGLGLALLIVAAAGPRRGLEVFRSEAEVIDIVLLVDVSTSMRAEDFSESGRRMNRLEAVQRVAREFVRARRGDRIGLIVFAAVPYTMAPPTLDHGFVLARLEEIRPGMVEDGTAIGDALASAVNRLRESEAASRIVVLLTDGENNMGVITPVTAAQAAQAMGVRVYTVGASSQEPAPFPVDDPFGRRRYVRVMPDVDDGELTRLAELTGGLYFRATDFDSLKKVYAQIDELERTVVEEERFLRFEERFAPWVWAGLLLLGIERILGLTRLAALTGG